MSSDSLDLGIFFLKSMYPKYKSFALEVKLTTKERKHLLY